MTQRDSQRPRPEAPRSGLEGRSRRRKRGYAGLSFETPRAARLLRMRSVEFGSILKAATLGVMTQLFSRLKALALIAFLAFCASAHAAESDKGVLADLISRALSSPGMSVSIRAVAQGRQGSARLEQARFVQPTARSRPAHDRPLGASAAPASLGPSAGGYG